MFCSVEIKRKKLTIKPEVPHIINKIMAQYTLVSQENFNLSRHTCTYTIKTVTISRKRFLKTRHIMQFCTIYSFARKGI